MKKVYLILVVCFLLVACLPAGGQTGVQPERPEPTHQPEQVPVTGQEETAVPLLNSASGVAITTYLNGHTLSLVNPLTGEPMPGYEPLSLGRDGMVYTASADGSWLATVAEDNQLLFVHLPTWTLTRTDLHFYQVNGLVFNADNSQVAVVYNGTTAKLALVDVATGQETADKTLPFTPRWNQVYFTPDNAVLVYGTVQPTPYNQFDRSGAVRVALLQTPSLTTLWETELNGLLDGVICEVAECEQPEDPRLAWAPAVVLAQDGRFLYIVHADEDKLTTVNLVEHTVQTYPIAPALSWAERLVAFTAAPVYAKEFDYIVKSAVLSPDGRKLYVVGWHSDLTTDGNGEHQYVERPLGLQVIDTHNGSQLASQETGGQNIFQSADGAYLFINGWEEGQAWTAVVDANTLATVKRLDGYNVWPYRQIDGQPILVASQTTDVNSTLAVLDPVTFEWVGSWSKAGYVDWVVRR